MLFFYVLLLFDIAGWLTFCSLFFFIIILEAIATVVNMIVLRFVPRFVPMCNFCAPIYFQTFRFQIENFASLYFSFQLSALPLGTVLKHSPPCQPAQLCPPPRSQPDKSFVIVVGWGSRRVARGYKGLRPDRLRLWNYIANASCSCYYCCCSRCARIIEAYVHTYVETS